MHENTKPCPNCGHCPTCGRSNAAPVYPHGWWWLLPPINIPTPWFQPNWQYIPGHITYTTTTVGQNGAGLPSFTYTVTS